MAQIYPESIKRIDFPKIVEKTDKLFNNTSLLLDEAQFKENMMAEAQAMQQRAQILTNNRQKQM
ncbi:MAG: hypothetical protein LBT02_00060 [Rickettsiales bacterium]|nr:hypothetical protein [Rickettsiales bacterium]